MSVVLYHYVHCPFCVRVRMALGFLNIPFESRVLPYDDEKTPVELSGKKMLPIAVIDQKVINESLDIIAKLDEKDALHSEQTLNDPHFPDFQELLNKLGSDIHSLAMPVWIWTPEFSESSRAYFKRKKEEKRGPFNELYSKKNYLIQILLPSLETLAKDLKPFYRSETLSLYDIMLASHLWGLYVVPEFQFPVELHRYLQRVKDLCRFDYHEDFWRG
jgi:glutaredoxin 2